MAICTAAWLATRGFDRTDEGFYLNSIAHPGDDASTILLFGYAYHPFYVLFAGDVVALRWAGMLLSVLAVGSLAWVSLKTPALVGQQIPPLSLRASASLGLGATALLTLAQMPTTPSYNTLALQGVSFTATGLVLTVTRLEWKGVAGAALLGVGLWLTFMGKPTTAGLLLVVLLGVTFILPGTWRGRLCITAGALLPSGALTLLLADMRFTELVTILSNGLATSLALGGHDQIIRIDGFPPPGTGLGAVVSVAAATAVTLYVATRHRAAPSFRFVHRPGTGAFAAASGLCACMAAAGLAWRIYRQGASGFLVTTADATAAMLVTLGGAIAFLSLSSLVRSIWSNDVMPKAAWEGAESLRAGISLVGAVTLLPAAYALGTNGNLWTAQGRAACFPLLTLSVLMFRHVGASRRPLIWTMPLVSSLIILILLMATTAASPYRYPPLQAAVTPTPVGSGTVRLTASDHRLVTELIALGHRLHINEHTRVLDLTGDSPGSVFLLGARPVGQAWIIGGYSGSEAAARLALAHDRCNIFGSLLMVAEGAPRAIPTRVLNTIGVDFPDGYIAVGSFHRPGAPPGRADAPPRLVTVYSPREATRAQACRS